MINPAFGSHLPTPVIPRLTRDLPSIQAGFNLSEMADQVHHDSFERKTTLQ